MLYTLTVKIRDLFETLKINGWELDRIRGSHHVFVHSKAKRSITVPVHTKELPDFYAKAILKQAQAALNER